MHDIIIIGSGPAGLSAGITARARGKDVLLVSNNRVDSGFYKAHHIDNYPGLPGVTGAQLSGHMFAHATGSGVKIVSGRVTSAAAQKGGFAVGFGAEAARGRALILAIGVVQSRLFPGEAEFLGRGVSYCATCDGMFYRSRRVAVVELSPGAAAETEHLRKIGCDVTVVRTDRIEIHGASAVTHITAEGAGIPCDCVFILRASVAPATLLPGLALDGAHIAVSRGMETSIPGVFACGDCAGAPYQAAKAAGEGQIAALAAVKYIDEVRI
ncbi:MAG: NAD(P)/FAD-dependent oxidoreductase [Oscillospiraceae bacterium]|jgi:thioredoxin reductase (NADPH)|nr:NAD(P)/FAD-dependent oxidoreductase [Oscillospiraceae bacterium]